MEEESESIYCCGFETPSLEYIVYPWTHIGHRQVQLCHLNEVSRFDLNLALYSVSVVCQLL